MAGTGSTAAARRRRWTIILSAFACIRRLSLSPPSLSLSQPYVLYFERQTHLFSLSHTTRRSVQVHTKTSLVVPYVVARPSLSPLYKTAYRKSREGRTGERGRESECSSMKARSTGKAGRQSDRLDLQCLLACLQSCTHWHGQGMLASTYSNSTYTHVKYCTYVHEHVLGCR